MSEKSIAVIHREAAVAVAPEKNRVQRVAAYCRVSTLQEEQADSYEVQCEYFQRFIDADPSLTLVDIYGDYGFSGLSVKKRPEFQRMMNDCMAGKIDLIMSKSISRFARNLADCIDCVRTLKEKGIPVIFEKEGLNTMDPGCDMLLSVLAALAQEESNNISRNMLWAYECRNMAGNPKRAARYGYRRVRQDDGTMRWEIYEPEAERVRLAFHMASAGSCYQEILRALNVLELRDKTGVDWNQARIRSLLMSEVYIGDILTNKTYKPDLLAEKAIKNCGQRYQYYIEEHHEGIVDKETFERVAEMVNKRKLNSNRKERKYSWQ